VLLVVVVAVTMLDAGADAHNRRRRHRQATNKGKNSRVEERQVSTLGVSIDFTDREATLPPLLGEDAEDFFSGNITGFKNECQGRILVEIFRANGEAIASVEASDSGAYSVGAEDPAHGDDEGSFFARATRYGTGKGARFACGKGISDSQTFTDGNGGVIS
jgi:hypothetical protein